MLMSFSHTLFFFFFFYSTTSITVANSNENDERMDSSNFGRCVDIFAPVSFFFSSRLQCYEKLYIFLFLFSLEEISSGRILLRLCARERERECVCVCVCVCVCEKRGGGRWREGEMNNDKEREREIIREDNDACGHLTASLVSVSLYSPLFVLTVIFGPFVVAIFL